MRITPLGAVVPAHGRDLLAKAQAMAAAVDRFKAGDGRVDIGTFQSVSEEETDQPQVHELDLMFFDGRIDGEVEHLKLLDDLYLLVARRAPRATKPCCR